MDHLNGTPNFTLQHLRFLVIDEADRLLAQSFQDWLTQVLAATRPPAHVDAGAILEEAPIPYPDALSPAFLHLLRGGAAVHTDLDEKRECSCQKLLFSATLMNDPGRIAALELRSPRYIVVQSSSESQESGVMSIVMEKFSIPTTLRVRNNPRLFVLTIKVEYTGTHGRVRLLAKAAGAFPSSSLCWNRECVGVYQVRGIDAAAGSTVSVLRDGSLDWRWE